MVPMKSTSVVAALPLPRVPSAYPLTRLKAELNAIKGGGACHLREKVLAEAADEFVLVADWRKNSEVLGKVYTLSFALLLVLTCETGMAQWHPDRGATVRLVKSLVQHSTDARGTESQTENGKVKSRACGH
jgi:hypothetical protein